MDKNLSDSQIQAELLKSVNKLPWEMKKVKLYLWILKKLNFLKKLFYRS